VAGTNFNYQVALKEGLKSLQQGRLRQAEQSFKYLVDKFPGAEGGYRGLAKVHFEQEDRAGALRVLRDGAAALSRSGERSQAIGLLREAVALDARDLSTHRRLAAALALAGDPAAAVQEYARFIRDLRDGGEVERAKIEVAYAMGQLRDAPGVDSLERIANGDGGSSARAETSAHEQTSRSAFGALSDLRPHTGDPWAAPATPAQPAPAPLAPTPTVISGADDPWGAPEPAARRHAESVQPADTWSASVPAADAWAPAPSSGPEPSAPERTEAPPEDEVVPPGSDSEMVEAAAARYLATRDPRAAPLALEAARRYIRDGQTDAASDLLLQLIAAGVADHDAQRLLVEVARTLGKREVAKAKCQLLVQALLLDGRNDLAAEVEALAQAE
jgi:tetratricopeptide (TPR) repeat protein